jgi:hypothetical protein
MDGNDENSLPKRSGLSGGDPLTSPSGTLRLVCADTLEGGCAADVGWLAPGAGICSAETGPLPI